MERFNVWCSVTFKYLMASHVSVGNHVTTVKKPFPFLTRIQAILFVCWIWFARGIGAHFGFHWWSLRVIRRRRDAVEGFATIKSWLSYAKMFVHSCRINEIWRVGARAAACELHWRFQRNGVDTRLVFSVWRWLETANIWPRPARGASSKCGGSSRCRCSTPSRPSTAPFDPWPCHTITSNPNLFA